MVIEPANRCNSIDRTRKSISAIREYFNRTHDSINDSIDRTDFDPEPADSYITSMIHQT